MTLDCVIAKKDLQHRITPFVHFSPQGNPEVDLREDGEASSRGVRLGMEGLEQTPKAAQDDRAFNRHKRCKPMNIILKIRLLNVSNRSILGRFLKRERVILSSMLWTRAP